MPRVLDVRAVLLSHTARGLHDENAADSESVKVIQILLQQRPAHIIVLMSLPAISDAIKVLRTCK